MEFDPPSRRRTAPTSALYSYALPQETRLPTLAQQYSDPHPQGSGLAPAFRYRTYDSDEGSDARVIVARPGNRDSRGRAFASWTGSRRLQRSRSRSSSRPGRRVRHTSPFPRRRRYFQDHAIRSGPVRSRLYRSRSSSPSRPGSPVRQAFDRRRAGSSPDTSAHHETIDVTRPLEDFRGRAPQASQPHVAHGIPAFNENGNQVVVIEGVQPRHRRSVPVVEQDPEPASHDPPPAATFSDSVPVVEAPPGESVDYQDGDIFTYDNFNFIFPTRSPMPDSSREMDTSDSEYLEHGDAQPPARDSNQSLARGKIERIYSSHYEGSYEIGTSHDITLTKMHDPNRRTEPLFRWLHIQQTMMNFNDLWTEVSRMSNFSERERAALSKVRAELMKTCVRTRHNFKGAEVGYVEPRAFEIPVPPLKNSASSDSKNGPTVKWICLPYFALKNDGGLASASSSTVFPSQTLTQAQFSRSDPQRDTEQAVRQLGLSKKDEVFHIAQLWCIVVQNNMLITCGTMNLSELQGSVINIGSMPSPKPALALSSGRILVSYGSEVVWCFNASDCASWFAFVSRFAKAWWPTSVRFKFRGRDFSAKDWPKILHIASKPKAKVTLYLEKKLAPPPFTRGCPLYKSGMLDESKNGRFGYLNDLDDDSEYLHLLLLHSAESPRSNKSAQISLEALRAQLAAAEHYLIEETAYTTRRAYNVAPEISRTEIYAALKSLESEANTNSAQDAQARLENSIDIVNASEILYRMFFPASFEGPTTRKFWGAIQSLLQLQHPHASRSDSIFSEYLEQVSGRLITVVKDIPVFQSVFAYSSDEDRAQMTLPQELTTAWLHVVTGAIIAAKGNEAWRPHLTEVERLLELGMQKMVEELPVPSLLESAAMLPMEVLTLTMTELLKDQVGKSDNILETYSEYLNTLDNDITNKPSDRAYQHLLDLVQQEMKAIKWNLAKQQWIISRTRSMIRPNEGKELVTRTKERGLTRDRAEYVEPPPYYIDERRDRYRDVKDDDDMFYLGFDDRFADEMASASKLSATDPRGFRGLFLLECARLVEQREYEFKRFSEYAEDLDRAAAYKMDWTKDRQENAIYAFTLVTIIFLPLSAISSIFGMNTADVRDMKQGQWLYWVVALPVTLLVIVIGLWWMNELDNLVGWARGKQTSRASPTYATTAATRPADNWYLVPEPRQTEGTAKYDSMVSAIPLPPQSPAYNVSGWRPSHRFRQRRHETDFSAPRRRGTAY